MFIVASFEYSLHTELAVSEMIEKGLTKEQILALPMQFKDEPRQIMDTIYHSDGYSQIDGAAILSTVLMTLGVIYGFVLEWGPIIWGLIGMVGGFAAGFLIDFYWGKARHSVLGRKPPKTELIIMVDCREEQIEMVKKSLWDHRALGMAMVQ